MTPRFCLRWRLGGALALILLQAGSTCGQMKMCMGGGAMDTGDPVPPEKLPAPQHISGVGNARFPITANARAQAWFEQGFNLLYDFWDYEADRAFEEGIRSDANCAMCYWGLYQSETFSHSEIKNYADESLAKAIALEAHVSPREKLYLQAAEAEAAAVREAGPDGDPKFDHEIEIIRTLVKENPSDTNARILLSDAVSEGYDDKGEPKKGKKEALALLQGVLQEEPNNSVANHLWIHAVEASPHPEQALHSAEMLGSLAPASGHMVHMPGHIFYRTGDYNRAQIAFDASMLTDESYMRAQHVAIDNDWNYVHNLMYSVANLMEAGRMAQATVISGKLTAARGLLDDTLYLGSARDAVARLNPELPIALRTGDWASVIRMVNDATISQGMPHMQFLAGGLSQFATGMQSVGAHEPDVAARHSALLDASLWRVSQEVKDQAAADVKAGASKSKPPFSPDPHPQSLVQVLSIMSLELRACMIAQENVTEAEKLFARARLEEKELGYHEPPSFIRPVAENEADALMTAGEYTEAKAALEAALVDRPYSGFALYGIALATEKSGEVASTRAAYQRFLVAWKTADPGLPQVAHAQAWLKLHEATCRSDSE